MKKLFLFVIVTLLFSQCGKEKIDITTDDDRMVPVTFELPLSQETRSYFGDLLPDGNIKWGNDNKVEYLYLSIPYKVAYHTSETGTIRLGELNELKAEVEEPTETLIFKGEVPANNLQNARQYHLYYLGNKGQGGEGTHVTNYYSDFQNILIGKTISFAKQTGDIKDLGDYHIAKIKVKANPIKDESGVVQSFELVADDLKNISSIAKLDLTGETTLGGTAAEIQSFTVLWNTTTKVFDDIIETVPGATIDVSTNAGKNSYISLLPYNGNVFFECSKGRYEFADGIGRNQLYIGSYSDDIEDARPLQWE